MGYIPKKERFNLKIKELPVAKLYAEHEGQRRLKKKRLPGMGDFDPILFDPPLVTPNGQPGKFFVLDGQHRVALATLHGIKRVECRVEDVPEPLFGYYMAKRNSSTVRQTPYENFMSYYASKTDWTVDIVECLEAHGLKLVYTQKGPDDIAAVTAVTQVHEWGGADLLDETFSVLNNAWGGDNARFKYAIIKGMGYLLHTNPSGAVDRSKLATRLTSTHPNVLRRNVGAFYVGQTETYRAIAMEALKLYRSRKLAMAPAPKPAKTRTA